MPESIKSPENDTKFTRYDSNTASNKYNTNSDFKLIQDEHIEDNMMAFAESP